MRAALILCFASMANLNSANLCTAEESWWQLLGPAGNGHASSADLPVHWTDQENVTWKTAIHDRGWSSPVIHGDQIWLTTATADGHKLYAVCVDKNTGRILHDRHVFDVAEPQKISDDNTYATPTPVIEQGRVFVHFGTYGTACLDSQTGETIWARRDLNCDHEANAGPAGSPTIIADNLVVHVDGRDVQYIIALDRTTGETVWKTSRSYDYSTVPVHQRKAYGMPGIAPRGDGIQLVSSVGQGVYAYDVAGRELWRVRHKGWSIAPRPVAGHGFVFAIVDHDRPELWAIRHDGSGDVTESHIGWKETRSMSARCTPLLVDDLLYVVNREGIITCLEAKTGAIVWKERLDGKYSATPIYAKDRIYLFDEDATCTIIRPGRKFDVLAVNSLASQPVRATPAVEGNSLIVRTADSLYRIEAAAADPRQSSASADDPVLTIPLVGYNEHRTNLPGGRHANISTNRAMVVKADGTGRRAIGSELVNEPGAWTQFAGWSPDGRTAVVLRGWESVENAQWEEEHKTFRFTPEGWLVDSFFVDVATGKAENVTAVDRVSFYNTGLFFWPNDPTKLGFTALIGGNSKPFRMDLDGRNKTDLTKGSSGFAYGFSSSPDGSRISYHENYQVYLANADGSNRLHVKTGDPFVFVPTWSPDGEWVLFVSGEHYNCHPVIVKADGTGLKKLADRGGYSGVTEFLDVPDYHGGSSDVPVWSVDGKSVFYTAKVGNNIELFRVTLDRQSERLTASADGTSHYHPRPSPDGKWIVYGSKRNGVRNLFVMRLSDRKEHALTDVAAGHATMHAHWQRVN